MYVVILLMMVVTSSSLPTPKPMLDYSMLIQNLHVFWSVDQCIKEEYIVDEVRILKIMALFEEYDASVVS